MIKRLLPSILFILFVGQIQAQISGFVFDENKTTLPGANLLLLPDSLLSVTETNGQFEFDGLSEGTYQLVVTFIGYSPDTVTIKVNSIRNFRPTISNRCHIT